MDYSSVLNPAPQAAPLPPQSPPATATPQWAPVPISYPVGNPQEQVKAQGIPPQAAAPVPAGEPAVAAPPASPGLWEKFQTNPNLMQAALMSGLRLMNGQQNGQDTFGLVSDALMAGNLAYQYTNQNATEEERKATESKAQVDWRTAQTAQTVQETSQKAQMFPQTLKKVEQEIKNLETSGRLDEARALKAEFDADPQRMADNLKLDQSVKRANINQSNAAAGASGAAARASNALTGDRELTLSLKKELLDPKTTPERKAQIEGMYRADDPQSRVVSAKSDELTRLVKAANPQMTDQEVAAEVLQRSGEAKSNYMAAAIKVLDNPDGYDIATVEAARKLIGDSLSGKANKGASTPVAGDVATRHKADPAMAGTTLGKPTTNGIEVIKNGKIIGYYK